jgi:hypothetical protein
LRRTRLALDADRPLHHQRARREPLTDLLDHALEVGADAVHLVDERDARDVVAIGLPPDRLGLRLDPAHRTEHRDRTVEHAQRALHLDREVHVTGCIDDVDAVIAPEAGGGRRGDRDPSLLLLHHPVHGRRALVNLAELVTDAGVEQDALGRGGLAGIDVGHDADIARPFQRLRAHDEIPRAPFYQR